MKKQFPLRLDEQLKKQLESISKSERRSLNQQIEKILQDHVLKSETKKV